MEEYLLAQYGGYYLFDELYDDDDGFQKHTFIFQNVNAPTPRGIVPNTSSYTSYEDALEAFYAHVRSLMAEK